MKISRKTSRRGFLGASIAAGGLAIVVVACGGAAAPAATDVPTSAPAQPAAPVATATTAAAAPAAASSNAPTATAAVAVNPGDILINGAGSSFDNPLFSKAFGEYTKANPTVKVNYQSIGSGAGITQLTKGTVDFGATDAPMDDKQITDAGGDIVHIPVTLGAVAVTYNLPNVPDGLKLNGAVLADIFLGKIVSWSDPAIMKLNAGVTIADTPVAVVHRSDGSGTTDIFTTFLSQSSPEWKTKAGNGTAVNWPVGIGGKGSEGVAGQVKQTPGGIGYFELAYAKQNKLLSAAIDDGTGVFAAPSSDGASACAGSVASYPADLRQRIAGCSAKGVYPISGLSWIVIHKELKDPTKGAAMTKLLWWLVHEGQAFSADLFYAPLPANLVKADEEKIRGITSGGKPLMTN